MTNCRILLIAFLLNIHNSSGSGLTGLGSGSTDEELGSSLEATESDVVLGESGSGVGQECSGGSELGPAGSNGEDEVVKVLKELLDLENKIESETLSRGERRRL